MLKKPSVMYVKAKCKKVVPVRKTLIAVLQQRINCLALPENAGTVYLAADGVSNKDFENNPYK